MNKELSLRSLYYSSRPTCLIILAVYALEHLAREVPLLYFFKIELTMFRHLFPHEHFKYQIYFLNPTGISIYSFIEFIV